MFSSKKSKIVTVVAALALISASAAFAAWYITGQGTGRAKIGTLTAPLVTDPGSVAIANCYPGGDCDLYVNVNPGTATGIKASAWKIGTGYAIDSLSFGSCPSSNLTANPASLNNTAFTPMPTLAPNVDTLVTLPNALHLSSSAPSTCQGVEFTVSKVTIEVQAG